jgi:hypothetical protein
VNHVIELFVVHVTEDLTVTLPILLWITWPKVLINSLGEGKNRCKNALTIDSRQTSSYSNEDTTIPLSFLAGPQTIAFEGSY